MLMILCLAVVAQAVALAAATVVLAGRFRLALNLLILAHAWRVLDGRGPSWFRSPFGTFGSGCEPPDHPDRPGRS